MGQLTSIEVCAGAGGQALGLEQAGFRHLALVEIDRDSCATLRHNCRSWNVIEGDLKKFHAVAYRGKVDLLAGGVPCPPFSVAGKQLGAADERDLFPEMIRLARECKPRAVLIENVRGLLNPKFDQYRNRIADAFTSMGYVVEWNLVFAADHGVPQLRPRTAMIALRKEDHANFTWPPPRGPPYVTVGRVLGEEMRRGGWEGAKAWSRNANTIAPTLVGGSKKHGGPDLGPTRAKKAWAALGVDGKGVADAPPQKDFKGTPRLTVRMAALLQGFPRHWHISGRKTSAYRQVGNAFPPPVAAALGAAIAEAFSVTDGAKLQGTKRSRLQSVAPTILSSARRRSN